MTEPFYITTAISYPNGAPHIGHAYELIASDVLARFHRLDGREVFFLTGTDEHGLKMQQTAAKEGITPAELVERNSPLFIKMAEALNSSHDDFIRTSQERHKHSVQALWQAMEKSGDIYLDRYAGWYSVRDEAFYAESETTLSEDGTRLGPQGTPVTWTEEESYFFRLSAYEERLLELYKTQPDFIQPEGRKNEVVSFVKGGLKDLSISRTTFDWGIPVPDRDGHVMYVWVDALANYISACGYPDKTHDKAKFWPASVHIIGKDIVRFHAVYWPAFLMSAGVPLPKAVFGHGFLFNRGEKMSKSVGNVIDPIGMAAQYGVDAMRYFFMREVPFGQDGSYSHEAIVNRINADLANDLGNLAQRSLSMIAKNCGGVVPQKGTLTAQENELLQSVYGVMPLVKGAMEKFAIHEALNHIWGLVGEANRYFTASEPWALKKTDPARMQSVLYVTAEVLRNVGLLVQPVVPVAAAKLLDLLSVDAQKRTFAHLGAAFALSEGATLPEPSALFPRYVEIEDAAQQ